MDIPLRRPLPLLRGRPESLDALEVAPLTPPHVPSIDDAVQASTETLQVRDFEDLDSLVITQSAYSEAQAYFVSRAPEAACLLLGPRTEDLITHILVDDEGEATPASFTLAAESLNRKVKPYLAAGLNIQGIWHLHPPGYTSLSDGDLAYALKLFRNPKHGGLCRFALPITTSSHCYPFVLTRQGHLLAVRAARLILV